MSRRKLLGTLGVLGAGGAAGAGTTFALLSDQEQFGTANNPNVLQSGAIDLTVDWEVTYFGPGGPETIDSQPTPVDRPGPIVDLVDLKPGDIVEQTLSTHIDGNPAFLTVDLSVLTDADNGINNPEDAVDGVFDGSDGTSGGDLAENLNCVMWYDGYETSDGGSGGSGGTPGNNRPDEGIWIADGDPTVDADFEAGLDGAQSPSDAFDTSSDLVIASGTLAEVANVSEPILVDSRDQGDTPAGFEDSACYDAGSIQYVGFVCWLPRDVAGIDDNLLQTDRLEYQLAFGAIQCRDNVADDGTPISTDVATQPGGASNEPPTASFTWPEEEQQDLTVTFDGSGSTDSDGTIVDYTWYVNGTKYQTDTPLFPYEFPRSDYYEVTLVVTDDDGATGETTQTIAVGSDADNDGYTRPPGGTDCDDINKDVHPGHEELADDIDNDCDGEIDEGVTA